MKWFLVFFASGLGVGFSPIAPGTMGTLMAIPFYLLLSRIPTPLYELTLVTFFFFSVWISENAEKYWGKKDDPRIVIDEIMGFIITMLWLPQKSLSIVFGFFLFRVFDIFKPPPIRHAEGRFRGGLGIVLDDVLAGVYANLVLQIITRMGPWN